ncbi:hypothetical protein OO015_08055 [Thermomicrobium sp. 4228-Ro]|uniref:hypothetical protein n=1 Tax=Thermomicrobium sp. 4228-Ro TaxID=2993937 RepID=UPI002248F547|nr:hypothetical protein [Thermomicrobium sp. 4228-Ro]MCX2727445.1 hypothetical protein [Thermomicrobium sp. 4228-Ro]
MSHLIRMTEEPAETNGDEQLSRFRREIGEVIRECRQVEQAARSARQLWEEVLALLPQAAERPFGLLAKLDKLESVVPERAALVAALRSWADTLAEEQLTDYTRLLRRILGPDETVEGRLQDGYRIRSLIEVRVDYQKYEATIATPFRARRLTGDISVYAVAEAIRSELERLFDRPFHAGRFAKELFEAYQLALVQSGTERSPGEPVPILAVHKFVVVLRQSPKAFQSVDSRHFRPYPPDEFAVDLGRLLATGQDEVDGWRLRLHPIRKVKDSLYVVNFGTGIGQNYGLLSFQRVHVG